MTKYTFRKQEKEPSDQEISRRMNFQAIVRKQQDLQHYRKATQPLYKKPWFLGFVVLMGIILLLLVLEEPEEKKGAPPTPAADSTHQPSQDVRP